MNTAAARPRDRVLPVVGSAIAVPGISAGLGFLFGIIAMIAVPIFYDDSGRIEGLGALLIFVAFWIVGFLLASIAVGIWFARRPWMGERPWGALAALFAFWVPVSVVVGAGAAWFGYRSGLEFVGGAFGVLVALALLATAVDVIDASRLTRIWLLIAGVAAVFVILVVLVEPSHRRSIYASSPPPMALVDEAALAEALPGWRVAGYEDAPRGGGWPSARAKVVTSAGVALEITFVPGRPPCSSPVGRCEELSALRDGSPVSVWRDSLLCGEARRSAYISVDAERPEGQWSVDSKNRCADPPKPTIDELRTLLDTLQPVTIAEWVDAT